MSRIYNDDYRKCAFIISNICLDRISNFKPYIKIHADIRELRARLWSQTKDFHSAIIELDNAITHSNDDPHIISIDLLGMSYFNLRLNNIENDGIFRDVKSILKSNKCILEDTIYEAHLLFRIGIDLYYKNNPECLSLFLQANKLYQSSKRDLVIKNYYLGLLMISYSAALDVFGQKYFGIHRYQNEQNSLISFYSGKILTAGHDPFIYGLGIEKKAQIQKSDNLLQNIQSKNLLDEESKRLVQDAKSLRNESLHAIYALIFDKIDLFMQLYKANINLGIFERAELNYFTPMLFKPLKTIIYTTINHYKYDISKSIAKSSKGIFY